MQKRSELKELQQQQEERVFWIEVCCVVLVIASFAQMVATIVLAIRRH